MSAPALTGGRTWELVSPGQPISAQIFSAAAPGEEDDRLVYTTMGPLPGSPSGGFISTNIGRRSATGWTSGTIGYPYTFEGELFLSLLTMVAADFSRNREVSLWLSSVPLTPGAPPEGEMALYLRDPLGSAHLIAPLEGVTPLFYNPVTTLSDDGTQAVFSSSKHLLPQDAARTSGESIYRWTASGGLRLVDVANNGSLLSECGSKVSKEGISSDGNRVFFTSPAEGSCAGVARLYLRDGDTSTTEVSASHCTRLDCNAPAPISFAGATPDGAHVFFTTLQQLTNADEDEKRDLYRYDVATEHLELLSVPQAEAEGEVLSSEVLVSRDGSRVYFKASGKLVTNEGPEGGEAIYRADATGLHFVAPLAAEDSMQISADGKKLLLDTTEALSKADTDGRKDVYLYDAESESFICLSISTFAGNEPFDATTGSPLEQFGFPHFTERPASISADGSQVFFETEEKLLLADQNEKVDIYEWSAGGLGLLSSGTATGPAAFAGVSPDGRTAVFSTDASLVPADRDGGEPDLYAARIGGGFPPDGSECSCQESGATAKIERATPASATATAKHRHGRIKLIKYRVRRIPGATGSELVMLLRVPSAGLVSARLVPTQTRRHPKLLARASTGTVRAGKTTLTLHLSAALLKAAARSSGKVRLTVQQGPRTLNRELRLDEGR